MPSQVTLKALGLITSPNQLSTDAGAMVEAKEVIIKRDNVIEPRRGFQLFGESLGSSTDRCKQLMSYQKRLIRHYATTLDFQDGFLNDGTVNFTPFAGSYSEVEPGLRIKSIEANGNLYFTTSDGIKKISALNASQLSSAPGFITDAGGIKALDVTSTLDVVLGDQSSFFLEDSAVAYRVVWGTTDANNNLILGTPSQRTVIYNPMLNLILRDFSNVLNQLDNINQPPSLINDGNYITSLNLTQSATSQQLKNNLVSLASKIDTDIFLADTAAVAPLQMAAGAVSANAGVVTVTFTSGNPTQYISIGDSVILAGFTIPTLSTSINTFHTVTNVTATTIQFVITPLTVEVSTVAGTIYSYNYRALVEPLDPSTPTTHDELSTLQIYLNEIILRLQVELSGVIPTVLETTYIDPLDITTTASVILTITIPPEVTSSYFYQVYRSSQVTATGTTVLSDLVPSDEMQLVFEGFPTAAELLARQVIVHDITPDQFRGANLYTNEASGEGLAQANDVPPLAKDINRYKNVIFYANTSTRQRLLISLLGVSNMLNDYFNGLNTQTFTFAGVNTATDTITIAAHGYQEQQSVYFTNPVPTNLPAPLVQGTIYYILNATANTFQLSLTPGGTAIDLTTGGVGTHTIKNSLPSLTITNGITTQTYTFVKGVKEVTTVTTKASAGLNSAGTASYWNLYSANDLVPYYVWYKLGTATDPMISGKTGIPVTILAGDTATQVASKTRDTLNVYSYDFTATSSTNTVTITNTNFGKTTDATDGNGALTLVVINVQGNGEDASLHQVLLSDSPSPAIAVDETAQSLVRVINSNPNDGVFAFYISSISSVPGKIFLESRSLGVPAFYILGSNPNVGISFNPTITPNLVINNISVSSQTVLTFTTPHGLLNGDSILITDSNSTPSIDGLHLITYISATQLSIPVNVTVAGNYAQAINAASAEFSQNEAKVNRIYYSKFQQPEAVPLVNYVDVGAENKQILRIFPLRDSLFIFKEDGLFRLSGETAPFVVALFDSSCILKAPDSLSVSNNTLYGWTTQGIQQVTESGAFIISRNIDVDILKLATFNYTNFNTVTWGIGYESDNSYTVYTLSNTTDTEATRGYRFSNLTSTWTTTEKSKVCGIINPADDKMYLGAGDTNFIEQERKEFERYDYSDRQFDITLLPNNFLGFNMRFGSVAGIEVGDVLVQEQTLTTYFYNMLLKKLDNDSGITVKNYFSTLEAVAGDSLRTDIVDLANKLDTDPNVVQTNYAATIQSLSGVAITSSSVANPTVITSAGHGLVSGRIVNIVGHTGSTPSINGIFEVTVTGPNTFTIPIQVTQGGTGGTFTTINGDFQDIKACYDAIITKLNQDTGLNFGNYVLISNDTIQEVVITAVDPNTKQITVNLSLDFVQGLMTIYKAIKSSIVYAPNTMGDPTNYKHISEATVMFDNKAFTSAILSFATDLIPSYTPIAFNADSNGIFGHQKFGTGFFGGASNAAPFRTYIPRVAQRCRYFSCKFEHGIARESYAIYGITVSGENTGSTKAYR